MCKKIVIDWRFVVCFGEQVHCEFFRSLAPYAVRTSSGFPLLGQFEFHTQALGILQSKSVTIVLCTTRLLGIVLHCSLSDSYRNVNRFECVYFFCLS